MVGKHHGPDGLSSPPPSSSVYAKSNQSNLWVRAMRADEALNYLP